VKFAMAASLAERGVTRQGVVQRRSGELQYAGRVAQDAPGSDEGRLATTWQNKAAGRALKAARLSMSEQGETRQTEFAARLSRELGVQLSSTAVSNWENGRRSLPSAVLVTAALAAGQSLDALLGEAGEPAVTEWAEGLGLPARLADLQTQVDEMRQQVADLQVTLMDLTSARPPTDAGDLDTQERRAQG